MTSEPPRRVAPEIRTSWTLPSSEYHDPDRFRRQVDRVLARTWHLVRTEGLKAPGHVRPLTLLAGSLDEPVVLVRGDDGELRCLSNVCTHRGALVVEGEGHRQALRCRYHGRRFGLDGRCVHMPEFEEVEGFPSPSDDLPVLPLHSWGPLDFVSLDPAFDFDAWIAPVRERIAFLPVDRARLDRTDVRVYDFDAHWALYVDNYLEEFHIPYVHGRSLAGVDYEGYRTERFRWGNLQLGAAKSGELTLDLPADHPDSGERIGAFYFWLFPTTMLNVYPWGISVNVVEPRGPARTRVTFLPYVWDASLSSKGLGGDVHRVEMEDEEVVESVQHGVRSRLYDRGRFSPRREVGTHHFHELLSAFLEDGQAGGGGLTSPPSRGPG